MTTQNQSPVSREEWSDEIQNVAAAIYCGTAENAADAIGHTLDSIMSLQSQLTAAREDVERLGAIVSEVHSMAVQAGEKANAILTAHRDRAGKPQEPQP